MSTRFTNPWDATLNITGNVYDVPVYASGSESGTAVYTAPASKFFTAEIGAPARHVNWALKGLGDAALQATLHNAMVFKSGRDWAGHTIDFVTWSPSNRQFIIGSHSSATVSNVVGGRGPHVNGEVTLDTPAVNPITMVLDQGSPGLLEFAVPGITDTGRIAASTVTYYSLGFQTVRTAARSSSASIVIDSSGTASRAITISGTAPTSLSTTTTGFDVSTTAHWFAAQASPGSGPVLFATRGTTGTLIWRSVDGTTVTTVTRPDSTHYLGGLAWDAVQSLFVSCTINSGTLAFNSSADGITWAAMTGPQQPSGVAITSNIQFDICCGVWFIAGNQITTTNQVDGNGTSLQTTLIYSLDYGVTWAVADLDMLTPSATGAARITHSDNRIMVWTDNDLAVSGRLGS